MTRLALFLVGGILATALAGHAAEDEPPIVFRSDVSLMRVDAQVVDRSNRAITGLQREDFVLLQNGKKHDILNFESEDMPVDVLLLLDVSGSMQSHIQRLSDASHQALRVLGEQDRVAVMVFDRQSRLRMPFRSNRQTVEREIQNVLRMESFDGGTDITQALHYAANYIAREGRKEARRAIVILTDDETEFNRDDRGVLRSLARADSVLSALLAPDAMASGGYGGRGGGGSWPTGGGGMGGPLGGIIFGRRGPYGSSPFPGGGGPVMRGSRTQSAGTREIAERSGGDALRVDDASAFETTLTRIRQRYALHFNAEGAESSRDVDVEIQLADAARRRYPGSEVRYRRVNLKDDGSRSSDPVTVSKTPTNPRASSTSSTTADPAAPGLRRRRPAVNEDGSAVEPEAANASGGWRRADESDGAVVTPEPASDQPRRPVSRPKPDPKAAPQKAEPAPAEQPQEGGWRRVKPGQEP
jgi:VWFA-related protein